ncbi:MAG: 6-phosphogluconolactonase [Pirellula sp.]
MSTPRQVTSTRSQPRARPISGTNIPSFCFDTIYELSHYSAHFVAGLVRERAVLGQRTVIGLPAGSTPLTTFRELIRLHCEEGLDLSSVVLFSLDEYYGLPANSPQSHRVWLQGQLLDHVNIPSDQVFFLDGQLHASDIDLHCRRYDEAILHAGGLDLVILGIGMNGHIGFNEPFSVRRSRTRLCTLDPITRRGVASDFFGEDNVPTQALTVGLAGILSARRILLLAIGEHKAKIVVETLEKPVNDRVPASYLQEHGDVRVLLDVPAASLLKGASTPWLLGNVKWTDELIKRATLWLCSQTGKALLKLDADDFRAHDLHQLLRHHGPAESIAQRVFRWMLDTIDYHPAGEEPRKVLCFSPHPDDDVISMGGTLIRLNEDKHEVHIAYMTSGNIAVFDHDAQRVAELVADYNALFHIEHDESTQLASQVRTAIEQKRPGEPDTDTILQIKGLIRRSEARAGAIAIGCKDSNLHFLDLPFYRTGTIAKKPVGPEDIDIIERLLQTIGPEQIYVAGDLADPHGTHRVCAEAIFAALIRMTARGEKIPDVLLYRGAWQEYPLHEIEIAVPLSPGDLALKRQSIFMHESQKDKALFPGSDPREFWQRAEDRNRGTADSYNKIGLPEFFALEAFTRWKGKPI